MHDFHADALLFSCKCSYGRRAHRVSVRLGRRRNDAKCTCHGDRALVNVTFLEFIPDFRAVDRTPRQFFTIRLVAVAYRRLQTVVFVLTQKMCSLLTNHINTGNWMVTGGFDGTVTIYKSTIRFEDFEWTPYFWNRSHAAMITHCR